MTRGVVDRASIVGTDIAGSETPLRLRRSALLDELIGARSVGAFCTSGRSADRQLWRACPGPNPKVRPPTRPVQTRARGARCVVQVTGGSKLAGSTPRRTGKGPRR